MGWRNTLWHSGHGYNLALYSGDASSIPRSSPASPEVTSPATLSDARSRATSGYTSPEAAAAAAATATAG